MLLSRRTAKKRWNGSIQTPSERENEKIEQKKVTIKMVDFNPTVSSNTLNENMPIKKRIS
jgi:hypothetical protein